MTYKGVVYGDSLNNGKEAASFELRNNESLVYAINGETFSVDLAQADWKLGGFDHNMLYITPPSSTGHKALLVQDISILKDLLNSSNSSVSTQAKKLSGRFNKKKNLRYIGIASIILFFVFIGLIISGSGFDKFLVQLAPVEWDQKLGEYAYPSAVSSLSPGASKIDNKYVNESVEKIKTRLTTSIKNSKFNYTVTVLNSPVQNAFALPGGKIVVFTGLLKKADSADEVAGILAHEIMHVENRHSMRQITKNLGLVAVLNILLGDIEGTAGIVLSAGSELLSLGYSRSMEKEADTNGFKLLSEAGIDGQGMIHFFEKISEDEKVPEPLEFLSTHPMSEKRALFLADLQKKYPPKKAIPLGINWDKLKRSLK